MRVYRIILGIVLFIIGFYIANITSADETWPGILTVIPFLLCWIFGAFFLVTGLREYTWEDFKLFILYFCIFLLGAGFLFLLAKFNTNIGSIFTAQPVIGSILNGILLILGLAMVFYGTIFTTAVVFGKVD